MRRQLTLLTAFLALAAMASCGDGTDTTSTGQPADDRPKTDEPDDRPTPSEPADGPTADEPTDDPKTGTGMGMVGVHIEQVEGVFIEGFEVGLRFETPDGEVLMSTLWTDFVESLGTESIEAYYDSVLELGVPAGAVIVLATANVGAGPPPEVPDLDGDLRCRLEVDVPDGGRTDVEVTFDNPDDCLRLR